MKRQNQRGSTEAVLIAVLVIALLFALGWIFWQNFILKENPKKETETVIIDKNKDDAQSQEETLSFDDLGVEVPLSDNSYDFSVKKDGANYIILSSKAAEKCGNGYDGNVGMVNTTAGQAAAANAQVDGKAYYFYTPQAACSEDAAANQYQEQATKAFASQFTKLRSAE